MSFWNFLGEFAIFNMICNLFSRKSKSSTIGTYQPHYIINSQYEARIQELEDEIKESEKRIAECQKIVDNSQPTDIKDYDIDELQDRIDELEDQLESTGQKLADKRDKLKLADRQLAELQDELDALTEKRDNAQSDYLELTSRQQEQVRMRLTDAVFARMVVDVRSLLDAIPSELKAGIDGDFLTAIAEQPNEILKCAMYLFLGYLDGATQFAQSCGGGGGDNSLPWGRHPDEDDRRFAYRCMMQAHKMLKPSQPKRRIGGR